MHSINIDNKLLRTDLLVDTDVSKYNNEVIEKNNNYTTTKTTSSSTHYTTISFKDITDKNNFKMVQEAFIRVLEDYIKLKDDDVILVIGLGNNKSTPDSLGPVVVDNTLVTRYLFLMGDVEDGYSNVCSFAPNVTGNTGIETSIVIKSIIRDVKATKVIVVDALKTNSTDRLIKTIQITNQGISPGSGIGNMRSEISKKTMGIDIIAIGVPTVVEIKSIVKNKKIEENLIVTPTNIDFVIEKLGILIGNGINIFLHKNFMRQNNY